MTRTLVRLMPLALAVCTACDKGNVTDPDFAQTGISLSAETTQITLAPSDSAPRISCNVRLHATGGGGDRFAVFDGGTLRVFIGTTRAVPADSLTMSATDINAAFGHSVAPNEQKDAYWSFSAAFPFTGALEVRYHLGSAINDLKKATATFHCGALGVAAAPPTLEPVTLDPSSSLLPGDTLRVTLGASGSVGVWATVVHVSGPCTVDKVFFDRNAPSVTRTVRLMLPASCDLNQEFTVTTTAVDYLAQGTQRVSTIAPPSSDGQRPTLQVDMTGPGGNGVTGQYFNGDTLRVHFTATDNVRVRTIVWTLPGTAIRDSMFVQSANVSVDRHIIVTSGWGSASQIVFYARDPGGLVSDTVRSQSDFSIIPTVTHPAVTSSFLGTTAQVLADSKRGLLYLLDPEGGWINIVSGTTAMLTGKVELPGPATDMDFTVSGDSLAVSIPAAHQVVFVDLTHPTRPMTLVPVGSSQDGGPRFLRVAANGHLFHSFRLNGEDEWKIGDLNIATGVWQSRADAGFLNGAGVYIGRSIGHETLVLDGGGQVVFQRYDSGTDAFQSAREQPVNYRPVVAPLGTRVALGLDLYDADLLPVVSVGIRYTPGPYDDPPAAAFSPDGAAVYHLVGEYVYRANATTGRLIERFRAPTGADKVWNTEGSALIVTRDVNESTTHVSIVDVGN